MVGPLNTPDAVSGVFPRFAPKKIGLFA
jgi:hypothetical protein